MERRSKQQTTQRLLLIMQRNLKTKKSPSLQPRAFRFKVDMVVNTL